jgi:hypothetical protein
MLRSNGPQVRGHAVGLLDLFLGSSRDEPEPDGSLRLNPDIDRPLKCLQILYPFPLAGLRIDPQRVVRGLRAYHPWLAGARCELALASDAPFGLAGWDDHVMKLVGFSQPLSVEAVERCVRPAHYAAELRMLARKHQSHIQLYYAGFHKSPLEQYVALAALAGVLSAWGAIVVLNENAQTSVPAEVLTAAQFLGDRLELLRTLPLATLYMGFVKMELAGCDGVWMRTHGGALMGLPDLAYCADGHQQGALVFDLFASTLNYLLTAGEQFEIGHTMQFGSELYFRIRAPEANEEFLEREGGLFVLERIKPHEIDA